MAPLSFLIYMCSSFHSFSAAVADDFQTDDSNDSKADSIELDQDSDSLDSEKVLNLAFMEQENNDPG